VPDEERVACGQIARTHTPRSTAAIDPGARQREVNAGFSYKPAARRYDDTGRKFQQDLTFNLIRGPPPESRMKCGWGCGAQPTATPDARASPYAEPASSL